MVTLRFLRITSVVLVFLVCVSLFFLILFSTKTLNSAPIVELSATQMKDKEVALDLAPLFSLKPGRPSASIDALKQHLVYYSCDQRPDEMITESQTMLLGFKDSQENITLKAGETAYVSCEKGVFAFSQGSGPLWLKVCPENSKIKVKTGAIADITTTEHTFTLEPTKNRSHRGDWELASIPVDANFLIRSKMRWYGPDVFLEDHGGGEYEVCKGKLRIDIGEGEEAYACFLKEGEGLVWDKTRWKEQPLGEESKSSVLLYLENVQPQMLGFSLWDVGGKHTISLGLKIGNGSQQEPKHYKELTFCGARTLSQGTVRIGYQEWRIKPHDWLFYNGKSWEKLESRKQIEDYLYRRMEGELLIVDTLYRKGSQEKLLAHCYNPSRTKRVHIELPKYVKEGISKAKQHEFMDVFTNEINDN